MSTVNSPTSEGQRLLLGVEEKGKEIAAKVGVTPHAVSYWRRGGKKPVEAQRASLEGIYGIPADSWDQVPSDTSEPKKKAPKWKRSSKQATTLEQVVEQIAQLEELQSEPDLQAASKLKLADTIGRLLAIKARLERDREFLEDRIIREHPRWRLMLATILDALRAHPEALETVENALLSIGEIDRP